MGQGCHQSTGPVRNSAAHTTPTQLFLFQHPSASLSLLLLSLSLSRFISPLLLLFSFLFKNALLTKRFTNPGWYIIHDRLLWDWFRQMDSERGGRDGRSKRGGLHGKDGKVKRGVFLGAAALQNHHMGHVEYSFFLLHFEKPYIKRSLYSLYVREEAPPLWGPSGWGCTDLSAYACMEHL